MIFIDQSTYLLVIFLFQSTPLNSSLNNNTIDVLCSWDKKKSTIQYALSRNRTVDANHWHSYLNIHNDAYWHSSENWAIYLLILEITFRFPSLIMYYWCYTVWLLELCFRPLICGWLSSQSAQVYRSMALIFPASTKAMPTVLWIFIYHSITRTLKQMCIFSARRVHVYCFIFWLVSNLMGVFSCFSYLLGLLAKIKCSISSSQPDLWDLGYFPKQID